jgi:hypothetical protein
MTDDVVQPQRIRLVVSTADRSRTAEVTLPAQMTVADLLAACKKNWALPASEDFAVRDPNRNVQLKSQDTLTASGLTDGSRVEVYPLLEAGGAGV